MARKGRKGQKRSKGQAPGQKRTARANEVRGHFAKVQRDLDAAQEAAYAARQTLWKGHEDDAIEALRGAIESARSAVERFESAGFASVSASA